MERLRITEFTKKVRRGITRLADRVASRLTEGKMPLRQRSSKGTRKRRI